MKTLAAAVIVAAMIVGPALAKERVVHPGHAARAQAIGNDVGEAGISGQRAAAIRACND